MFGQLVFFSIILAILAFILGAVLFLIACYVDILFCKKKYLITWDCNGTKRIHNGIDKLSMQYYEGLYDHCQLPYNKVLRKIWGQAKGTYVPFSILDVRRLINEFDSLDEICYTVIG